MSREASSEKVLLFFVSEDPFTFLPQKYLMAGREKYISLILQTPLGTFLPPWVSESHFLETNGCPSVCGEVLMAHSSQLSFFSCIPGIIVENYKLYLMLFAILRTFSFASCFLHLFPLGSDL